MRDRMLALALLPLAAAAPGAAQAPPDAAFGRPDAFVAATPGYAFFSDPRVNLHDFLVWQLWSEEPVDPAPECLAARPAAEREAFEAARAHYASELAERNPGHDDRMISLRYALVGHPEIDLVPDSVTGATLALLEAALPAYRACWWERHDARNRAWIAAAVGLLIEHEAPLRARIADAFHAEWGDRIPVDVAGWVNWGGANTLMNPDHLMMSAADPAYRGYSALEMVLHESSHTLLSGRRGAVTEALEAASREAGLEAPPRNLWHVVLFYTTGRLVQEHLAEHGVPDYEPYVYREGLFERPWGRYREPVERAWQPYVDGRVDLDEAARDLIAALED